MKKRNTLLVLVAVLVLFTGMVMSCSKKDNTAKKAEAVSAVEKAKQWAVDNHLDKGDQTVDELYELAKKEGKVVLYSISSRCVRVKESFEKQYPGVICEAYDISTNELMEKITREYDAGIRNADLIHIKDMDGSIYQEKVQKGIFHNYYPEDICKHIDPKYMKYAMPLYIELSQWFYNYETNPQGQPVSSWWDLTKPEWKGRLLITNPLENNNYMAAFTQFVKHADDIAADYQKVFGKPIVLSPECPTAAHELLKQLVANDLVFISSSDEICESVGKAGQKVTPLGYAASSKLRKNESDGWKLAPINMTPATGIDNVNNLYIVNESAHPNAAKLLLRWMTGEADGKGAGFTPFNTLGGWPVRDDVAPPKGSVPLTDILLWSQDPTYIYENTPEMMDFWITLQQKR